MLSDTLRTSLISTMGGGVQQVLLMPIKNWYGACLHTIFQRLIDSKWSKGDHGALEHTQPPQKAQLWQVKQLPVMFIQIWCDTWFIAIFQTQIDFKQAQCDTGWSRCSWTPSAQRQINSKWYQVDHGALRHLQRPRQAQLWREQQVPVMLIKNWHYTCLFATF